VSTLDSISVFRDSEKSFADILGAISEKAHPGVQSSLSKKDIVGARYYSVSRINGSE
jgi:hypothetical protein